MATTMTSIAAIPKSVAIEETYKYSQGISSNPTLVEVGEPSGVISIVIPFACRPGDTDSGGRYTAPDGTSAPLDGAVGELETWGGNCPDVSRRIPLSLPEETANVGQTAFGRYSCRIEHTYHPDTPDVFPMNVEMKLLDEEILGNLINLGDVVAKVVTQEVSFRQDLMLMLDVNLSLPQDLSLPRGARSDCTATVTRVSVKWPALTHLRGFQVMVMPEDPKSIDDRKPPVEYPVAYNQLTRSLEWFNIPMKGNAAKDSEFREYSTGSMFLLINQPGELYKWDLLECEVEAVADGVLLSGLNASVRLYNQAWGPPHANVPPSQPWPAQPPWPGQPWPGPGAPAAGPVGAIGAQPVPPPPYNQLGPQVNAQNNPQIYPGPQAPPPGPQQPPQQPQPGPHPNGPSPVSPTFKTRLLSKVEMVMDDVFRHSTRAPFQQYYFDEVIPDPMRVADVKTALCDRGFNIKDATLSTGDADLRHIIRAERPGGADKMLLWIVVEGRRYATERRTDIPGPGGQVFTTMLPSGGITLYMRGKMPGETRLVLQEMMLIQEALRNRFERLRTIR